jgi:small GTP-binding protein
MTLAELLTPHQAEVLDEERRTIERAMDILQTWEPSGDDIDRLRQALRQLDELFLMVFVGEFNSGKSALINALLGAPYLKEGPTPTTDRVYLLVHGQSGVGAIVGENIRQIGFPVKLLEQVHIVDTPGTNAVLREHEAIARDFVPRSDLVVFITSADRPFTESERLFLEAIREWGKKVVIVVNKVDILDSLEAVLEVEEFVRSQVRRQLDFDPDLFSVSARAGMRWAVGSLPADSPEAQGFRRFQDHLSERLSKASLVQLKLLNPLGVARKLVGDHLGKAEARLTVLAEDAEALRQVDRQLKLYEEDTLTGFRQHLAGIENDLLQMSLRGETFLDEHMRLLKIIEMLQGRRIREAFEHEVVADTPGRVQSHVQEVIDWMVERELGLWRQTAADLGRRQETEALQDAASKTAGGFAYNRRQLLDGLGAQAERVIDSYDRKAEAERLTASVQESVAMVGLVEVGAIGLGLVIKAILTTAAADATGILAAGVLGVMGLAVIPWRRGVAKREFRRKMEDLRAQLISTLTASFKRELEQALGRLRESLAPYRRFVLAEETNLRRAVESLRQVELEMAELSERIEAI